VSIVDTRDHNWQMQTRHLVFALTFALSAAGCLASGGVRPYPLSPPTPQPLGPGQVSTLTLGFVVASDTGAQFVDDKDVSSLGGYFELLPGCHVISTPTPPGGRFRAADIQPRWTFALPMRAGHQYLLERRSGGAMSPTGWFTIKGYESDLRGNKTREFEHVTSPKAIEACQAEAAGSLPARL
jgi:hypothetical protein